MLEAVETLERKQKNDRAESENCFSRVPRFEKL